jgi:hypothetical protein
VIPDIFRARTEMNPRRDRLSYRFAGEQPTHKPIPSC